MARDPNARQGKEGLKGHLCRLAETLGADEGMGYNEDSSDSQPLKKDAGAMVSVPFNPARGLTNDVRMGVLHRIPGVVEVLRTHTDVLPQTSGHWRMRSQNASA